MVFLKARRRVYLCHTVLAVVAIVTLAALLPELPKLFRTYHVRSADDQPTHALDPGFTLRSPQLQTAAGFHEGIPSLLKTLQAYLEPQAYRVRQISATEIVGVLSRTGNRSKTSVDPQHLLDLVAEDGRDDGNRKYSLSGVNRVKLHAVSLNSSQEKLLTPDGNIQNNSIGLARSSLELHKNLSDEANGTESNNTIAATGESFADIGPRNSKQTMQTNDTTPAHLSIVAKGKQTFSEFQGVTKDPLVITPRADHRLRKVHFSLGENVKEWSGRSLLFSKPGEMDLKEEQYMFLQKAIWSGGWNISQLSEYSLEKVMHPWEWDIYKDASLHNIKETVDELFSKVELRNASTGPYRVGDRVQVRVDLYDGFGRARTRGGDDVRVWMRDDAIAAGLAVDVTDLHNGSYLATLPLLFPGTPEVKVSVTYPREIIRIVYHLRNVMKGMRLNVGGFVSQFASEATICTPFPFSGGYSELCNLTALNYNLSWYCGRPSNPALKCKHWKVIRDLEFPNPLPLTPAEKEWFEKLGFGHKHYLRLINNPGIKLRVMPGPAHFLNSSVLCNKRSLRESWTEETPRGFFLHSQWTPMRCAMPHVDVRSINECLRGSTLYMLGDSNLRHMLEMLVHYGLCTPATPLVGKRNWHAPQLCVNHQYKYLVRWRTHALPFHTNTDHWAPNTHQQSVGLSLDEIPASGKYIVILHMYLHFTTHHYSVYAERVRAMREAVERLLARNPQVQVVIRGPHAAFKGWTPMLGGDVQAKLYLAILKEEFKHLYDKILLLDFWEMSVAAENEDFHPIHKITQQMIRVLFGFVCS